MRKPDFLCAFVFISKIVQPIFLQNSKFQASSHLLRLRSLVCNPEDGFSHDAANVLSGTILGVPRQKPNNAKDMSTQNTSTKQSTKQCINKPTHLEKDESIDKGKQGSLAIPDPL